MCARVSVGGYHRVSLASLADLIRSESDFDPTADALPWQEAAINLLSADRTQRATRLDVSLATLFSGDDVN